MSAPKQDHARRFSGIAKLYTQQGLLRFTQAHIVVIGVGGVGSWTVESLARSGVGKLTLIDSDHLTESNINRQLPALDNTLGQAKVLALKARIAQINDQCKVQCIEEFITVENVATMLQPILNEQHHVIIDCIDHAKTKAALIAWCRQNKHPVLTVGAAGACIDPTRIHVLDLSNTQNDLLLARTRKHLRQRHHYPRNPKRSFCVPAIFSDESRMTDVQIESPTASNLGCSGYGSVSHVTASLGMAAAAKALSIICTSQ